MLTLLPWFSVVAFLTPAHSPLVYHYPQISELVATDTGVIEANSVLLTPALVTPAYTAVDQEVTEYLAAHPAFRQSAQDQAEKKMNLKYVSAAVSVWEYPKLVTLDTSIAAIFKQYGVDPAQFGATRLAAFQAIWELLNKQTPDTTLVIGKNVAFVQSHKTALATVWQTAQITNEVVHGINEQIQQQIQDQLNQHSDTLLRP